MKKIQSSLLKSLFKRKEQQGQDDFGTKVAMGPSRRRSYKLGLALRFHGPWVPRYEQQGPKNDKVRVSKIKF